MPINVFQHRNSERAEKALSDVYPNRTAGAETVLEAWTYMRVRSLAEIKGKFSESEIYYFVDVFNGTIIEPRFSCDNVFIVHQVQDGAKYDNLGEKWKVDIDLFVEKIKDLTSAQTFFLLEEIQRFWEKESGKKNSVENFAKQLSKS